ncbi:MAG: aminopeptidase P family protein [Clostridia bacterium]|nr:aminopeptidase P family protein [Clostridia bacterium]
MDGGVIEYLRTFGVELVSSADLMQHFGAVLTDGQIESHRQAGVIVHRILDKTFEYIRACVDAGEELNEYMLLQKMQQLIAAEPDLHMDSPPFFGVDDHAADPGYEPDEQGGYPIREGSRLIIDFAARLKGEDTIYYDISWCMNVGSNIDSEYKRLFDVVNDARTMVLGLVQSHLDADKPIRGCDVDRAVQDYFKARDMDNYLLHRTGHNIGHRCHGVGANLDDFETHDVRTLLPGTMFSVEPGIYTDRYGVRLEFDVHITPDKKLRIYGPVQNKILVI